MTSDTIATAVRYAVAASDAAHPLYLAEAVCVLLVVADHATGPEAESAQMLATLYARRWASLKRTPTPTTRPA